MVFRENIDIFYYLCYNEIRKSSQLTKEGEVVARTKQQRAKRYQQKLDHRPDDKSGVELRKRRAEIVADRKDGGWDASNATRRESNGMVAGGVVTNYGVRAQPKTAPRPQVRLAWSSEASSTSRPTTVINAAPRVQNPKRTRCRDQFCGCRGYTPLGAA